MVHVIRRMLERGTTFSEPQKTNDQVLELVCGHHPSSNYSVDTIVIYLKPTKTGTWQERTHIALSFLLRIYNANDHRFLQGGVRARLQNAPRAPIYYCTWHKQIQKTILWFAKKVDRVIEINRVHCRIKLQVSGITGSGPFKQFKFYIDENTDIDDVIFVLRNQVDCTTDDVE